MHGWGHRYLSSDAIGAVGLGKFPAHIPETLGAFWYTMGGQASTFVGKEAWAGKTASFSVSGLW